MTPGGLVPVDRTCWVAGENRAQSLELNKMLLFREGHLSDVYRHLTPFDPKFFVKFFVLIEKERR